MLWPVISNPKLVEHWVWPPFELLCKGFWSGIVWMHVCSGGHETAPRTTISQEQ
jgi:hypothetical protein